MRKIAVIGRKGGIGKTTTAFELAYMLSRVNRRVLLVDLDVQANLTKSAINIDDIPEKCVGQILLEATPPTTLELSSKNLLPNGQRNRITEALPKPEKALSHIKETLDLIPSDPYDESLSEIDRLDFNRYEGLIEDLLFPYEMAYDYCIIDTPANIAFISLDVLNAADALILPAKAEATSIDGLDQLIGHYEYIKDNYNSALEIDGILITQFDRMAKIYKTNRQKIVERAKAAGLRVFEKPIRKSSRQQEAIEEGKSIFEMPRSKLSEDREGNTIQEDYMSFLKEFLDIEEGEEDGEK